MLLRKAKKMQKIISRIAKKHGVDLSKQGVYLKLVREPYLPLVIETIGGNRVSVAHYTTQNGDAIQDPEIVFWMASDGEWYPSEITQIFGYQELIKFDNIGVSGFFPQKQRSVAAFANKWADNIRYQGWLDADRAN